MKFVAQLFAVWIISILLLPITVPLLPIVLIWKAGQK